MSDSTDTGKSPIREIIEPFINIARAPRALWGVNFTYFLEGMCYFGILTLLALFFNSSGGLDDKQAGWIVGAFTGGITLAMFFFGELADRWGIRIALILSLALMFVGRIFLTVSPVLGGSGMWSPFFFSAAGGLLLVVLGYGIYQPAAYSAVRHFTTPKTAAMGYAMLYALMNLGGFLPGIISPPIRASHGIGGIFTVYTVFTFIGMLGVLFLLTPSTVRTAIALARGAGGETGDAAAATTAAPERRPFNLGEWFRTHPLRDARFSFFIFILIPVQTLFAHQWLTMPQYVLRAYPDWVSRNMEFFVNLNPILIFVLTPMVAAFTSHVKVYKMMILGTTVMAAPTFLLALGPNVITLFVYIILMSVGEAMWQPRFLQLAAELAPEGKTGQYMGIAQFPWFLTKVITSLYSGYMLTQYCPQTGPRDTETLWLIYGAIAIVSPILLLLAKNWMGNRLQQQPAV